MSRPYITIAYRFLSKNVKGLIEKGDRDALLKEVSRPKYSPAVKVAALYYFEKTQEKEGVNA